MQGVVSKAAFRRQSRDGQQTFSVMSLHILAQEPFPVRTCTVIFPFTSVSAYALSKCLQTSFFCLRASFFVLMATGRASDDALHTSLSGSPLIFECWFSSWFWSRPMEWAPAQEILWMKSSMPFSLNVSTSKHRSRKFLLSRLGCPVWIHISRKHLENSRVDLQRWTEFQCHHCTYEQIRNMLSQHHMFPVRQDPGLHSNMLTAPQPQGPIAQGHLMTIETHDEDLTLPQAQKMNNHEVPFYFDSLVNYISKELHSGSIPFGMNLVSWHVTNLSEPIAKQAPCQSALFSKHNANVKTLLPTFKMMVLPLQPTVPSALPIQLSLCANPDQLKSERSENNVRRCGKSWLTNLKFFFLMQMTKVYSSFPHSILDPKSSASKIAETALEKWFSNLPHLVPDKRYTCCT